MVVTRGSLSDMVLSWQSYKVFPHVLTKKKVFNDFKKILVRARLKQWTLHIFKQSFVCSNTGAVSLKRFEKIAGFSTQEIVQILT